jgi:nitrogen fixation NifU-like protein
MTLADRQVRFTGDGCAISIAAASLLTEIIVNTDPNKISDDQLIAALESDIKPTRIQCALLPLQALRAGLQIYLSSLEGPPG